MAVTMTPRQKRFVEEYLVDLNATQAAIRAGYSKRTAEQQGHQLLKKTSVSRAIQTGCVKRAERTKLSQDVVINGLLDEAQLKGKGANHGARVAAWTALGKHLGMFEEKVRIEGNMNHVLTDEPMGEHEWEDTHSVAAAKGTPESAH